MFDFNEKHKSEYESQGFTVINKFFSDAVFDEIEETKERIYKSSIRKDLTIDDGISITPRRLRTLNTLSVKQVLPILFDTFKSKSLTSMISHIAGREVIPYQDPFEGCVVNILEKKGDCHGWHLDAFPLVINVAIDTPSKRSGGLVNVKTQAGVKTINLGANDGYILRSDTYRHQVSSLTRDTQRCVVSFAYQFKDNVFLDNQPYSRALYSK